MGGAKVPEVDVPKDDESKKLDDLKNFASSFINPNSQQV